MPADRGAAPDCLCSRLRAALVVGAALAASAGADAVPSLCLDDALARALEQSPALRAATRYVDAAGALVDEAAAAGRPQLGVLAGYTRFQEPTIVEPIHRAGVFPPLDDDIYEAAAQLRVPVLDGGRRRAARRAAEAGVEAAAAQTAPYRAELLEALAVLFVRAHALDESAALLGRHRQVLRQRARESEVLAPEGRLAAADTALLSAARQRAAADSIDFAQRRYALAAGLGGLLGAGGPVAPCPADSPRPPHGPAAPTTQLVGGPSVRAARASLDQARARLDQAGAGMWPEVSLVGAWSLRAGDDMEALDEWSIGLRLELPVLDGGRRDAGTRAARARLQAAEAQLAAARDAEAEAQGVAVEQARAAGDRRGRLTRAAAAQARVVAAQQELYREGRSLLSELLRQESELLQARQRVADATRDEQLARLHHDAVAGVLTENRIRVLLGETP